MAARDPLTHTNDPILVVDDDERFVGAITRLLKARGFAVCACTGVLAARVCLEQHPHRAVITDYYMPDGDGISLLREVRRRWPRTVRLLVSGALEPPGASMLLEPGDVHGFLGKPVTIEQLDSALATATACADQGTVMPEASARAAADTARGRILVADDEKPIRSAVCRLLTGVGYYVEEVEDGAAALARVTAESFDLVVFDMSMPGMTGIETLRRARAINADLDAILITANASLDTALEGLRAGAADLLLKPFTMIDLSDCIERVMTRRRRQFSAVLHEASRMMFTTADREALPERIVDLAARAIGSDDASLLLPDGSGRLYVAHTSGAGVRNNEAGPVRGRIAERIAASRQPALLHGDLSKDQRFTDLKPSGRPSSSIVYPLLSADVLVGVLTLNRFPPRHPFSRTDLERAGLLAAEVTLALENVRLVRTLVASERLATIGQLAAGIVHEINSPLAYVVANLEYLRSRLAELSVSPSGRLDEWVASAKTVIDDLMQVSGETQDGARRMVNIVQDMRVMASSETPRVSVCDLNDAIRSALRIAGANLPCAAKVATELGTGLRVHANAGQLSQVILNLLINADQAMADAGARSREIRLRSWREGEQVMASVTDTGPGISPALLARVFEPFFTTKAAGKGTGLGLAISRDIVARHQGELRVSSTLGLGTTFTMVLPAAGARTDEP